MPAVRMHICGSDGENILRDCDCGGNRRAPSYRASGNVPNGNWNRDNRQANVGRDDPENSDPENGCRASVKMELCAGGSAVALPPAQFIHFVCSASYQATLANRLTFCRFRQVFLAPEIFLFRWRY